MVEVGEYIRFEDGQIKLATQELKDFIEEYESLTEKDLVEFLGKIKHSKQLIDLIEVGDFVNGKLIYKIDKGKNYCYLYYENGKTFVDYQIEEILTREQYMENCFKVGGKMNKCKYCVEYNGDDCEDTDGFDYYSCELKNNKDLEKYGKYCLIDNMVDENECTHYLCDKCLFRKE